MLHRRSATRWPARMLGLAAASVTAVLFAAGPASAATTVKNPAAISIAEIGPLLMAPGRRCENGKPVPVDRADWQQYVQGLVDVGRAAYRASQTRSRKAVSDVTNQISRAHCGRCGALGISL